MEMTIKLSSESAYVIVDGVTQKGEMFQKRLTPHQLLGILSESFPEEYDNECGDMRLVPPIPSQCSTYEQVEGFYLGSESKYGSRRAIFYLPPERRVMYYQTTENPYVFEFPALIFYMETRKNKVDTSQMRIFAVKEKTRAEIGSDTKLYHYPFGNVYKEGRICWGSTQLPEIESFNDFKKIILTFFGGVTNDDLFRASERFQKKVACQRELLEYLVKEDKFPTDLLVDTKRTLSELETRLTN